MQSFEEKSLPRCFGADDEFFWILLSKNGVYRIDREFKKGEVVTAFPEYEIDANHLFYSCISVSGKLVLIPGVARKLVIYDTQEDTVRDIEYRQPVEERHEHYNVDNPFFQAEIEGEEVYIWGNTYPAILKLNVNTLELKYIDDWLEEVDALIPKGDEFFYFPDGGIRVDRFVYLPVGGASAVVRLDLDTDRTKVYWINCGVDGFDGGTLWKDKILCLNGRKDNRNVMVFWALDGDIVKKISLDGYTPMDGIASFWSPINIMNKLYLLPIGADVVFCVDAESEMVKKCNCFDSLLEHSTGFRQKIWAYCKLGCQIMFQLESDEKWYIYDTVLEHIRQIELPFDNEQQWKAYERSIFKKVIQMKTMFQEQEFSLKAYVENVMQF